MKALFTLLIFLSISLYVAQYSKPYCDELREVNNSYLCFIANLSSPYIYDHQSHYKCCYENHKYFEEGKFRNISRCTGYSKEDYDHLDKLIKSKKRYLESIGGIIEHYEVNCSSKYLYISLLSLIIFLL